MVLTGKKIGEAVRVLSKSGGKMKTIYRLKKAKMVNTFNPILESMNQILKEDGYEDVLKKFFGAVKENQSGYVIIYGGVLEIPQPKTWTPELQELYKEFDPFIEKAVELGNAEHEVDISLFKIEELPEEIDSQEEAVLWELTEF